MEKKTVGSFDKTQYSFPFKVFINIQNDMHQKQPCTFQPVILLYLWKFYFGTAAEFMQKQVFQSENQILPHEKLHFG